MLLWMLGATWQVTTRSRSQHEAGLLWSILLL